jgi:ADP-ribosylglycohydrolase
MTREKYRGAMLGLAAGDALGTTLEFKTPGTFKPITDMIGGGPFHLKPGECRGNAEHDRKLPYLTNCLLAYLLAAPIM